MTLKLLMLPTLAPDGATGGSLLADIANAPPSPAPPPPAPGSPQAALQDAMDGPPEWVPEKFWDKEKKAPRVEDLGRGYKNLEQLLGREKVPVPTSEDDHEGWERWFKAHGRPEKPDEYEFERPKELPTDLNYDEDLEKGFRDWAHQNGLNKRQAKNAHDWFVKNQVERNLQWHKMQKENRANAEVALRRELGSKYEGWVQGTGALFKKYADPEFANYLAETGLGNDPRFVKVFGRISQDMGGEQKLTGKPQQQAQPADVEKAIASYRKQHHEALWNKHHPENEIRNRELADLYAQRFPEQA